MIFFDGWGPILRILVIGPLAYISLVLLLRASGKRTLSQMNVFDFVVTIAIGSLFATVIINENVALATGVTAFGVLVAAQFVVTWFSVRWDGFERFIKAEPTLLFFDGQMSRHALRKVRVTEREIEAMARRAGMAKSGRGQRCHPRGRRLGIGDGG
ncbi:MAG TPA: DUF421 domain-containing protein [Acidimicrobiia bacterium]